MTPETPRYVDKTSGTSTDHAKEIALRFDYKSKTQDKYSKLREGLKEIVNSRLPKREPLTWKTAEDPYVATEKSDVRGLLDVIKRALPKANLIESKYAGLAYSTIFKTVNMAPQAAGESKIADVNWLEPGDKIFVENGTVHVVRKDGSAYSDFTADLYPWGEGGTTIDITPVPPKPKAKTETPKSETPKSETPKSETPKSETPKSETPKTETPKTEAPAPAPETTTEALKTDKEGIDYNGIKYFGTYSKENGKIVPLDGYTVKGKAGEMEVVFYEKGFIQKVETGPRDSKGFLIEGLKTYTDGSSRKGKFDTNSHLLSEGRGTTSDGTIKEGRWDEKGHSIRVILWNPKKTLIKLYVNGGEKPSEISTLVVNGKPYFGSTNAEGAPLEGRYEWWDQDSLSFKTEEVHSGAPTETTPSPERPAAFSDEKLAELSFLKNLTPAWSTSLEGTGENTVLILSSTKARGETVKLKIELGEDQTRYWALGEYGPKDKWYTDTGLQSVAKNIINDDYIHGFIKKALAEFDGQIPEDGAEQAPFYKDGDVIRFKEKNGYNDATSTPWNPPFAVSDLEPVVHQLNKDYAITNKKPEAAPAATPAPAPTPRPAPAETNPAPAEKTEIKGEDLIKNYEEVIRMVVQAWRSTKPAREYKNHPFENYTSPKIKIIFRKDGGTLQENEVNLNDRLKHPLTTAEAAFITKDLNEYWLRAIQARGRETSDEDYLAFIDSTIAAFKGQKTEGGYENKPFYPENGMVYFADFGMDDVINSTAKVDPSYNPVRMANDLNAAWIKTLNKPAEAPKPAPAPAPTPAPAPAATPKPATPEKAKGTAPDNGGLKDDLKEDK